MWVNKQKDYESMSEQAANFIIKQWEIHQKTTPNKHYTLGLPTGSTPLGVYQKLIQAYRDQKISFANVVTFNMDEYQNLSPSNPQSFHYFMWHYFFQYIDIKKENIHMLDGLSKNIEQHCQEYENLIRQVGGIDLLLGGLGSDGHLAFNEPGTSFDSVTGLRSLTVQTRQDNNRFFHNIDKVPTHALSVGLKTIVNANQLVFLVSGTPKASALQAMINGPIDPLCPASIVQKHPLAWIFCDEAAASKLNPRPSFQE